MNINDFKFVPMWAFEEGYLERQENLEIEDRDVPRKKYDFSGRYGSKNPRRRSIRAEDLAIIYELMFAFKYPLRGIIQCSQVFTYLAGWDPYIRPNEPISLARTYDGAILPPKYRRPKKDLFKSDKSYDLPPMPNPGSVEPIPRHRTIYDDEIIEGGSVCFAGAGSTDEGPEKHYEYLDYLTPQHRAKDNFTEFVTRTYVSNGYHDGNYYGSISRVDIEIILNAIEKTIPDPKYVIDEVVDPHEAEKSRMTYSSCVFEKTRSFSYNLYTPDGWFQPASVTNEIYKYEMQTVFDAARNFKIIPTSVMDALWDSTKMRKSKTSGLEEHPKVSYYALDTLYNHLNGLVFTRIFELSNDNIDSDDFYISNDDCILVRISPCTFKGFGFILQQKAKCETTYGDFENVTRCDYDEPEIIDFTETISTKASVSNMRFNWHHELVYTSSDVTFNKVTQEYTGTAQWHFMKRLDITGMKPTEDSAKYEISTPAGLPQCINVVKVNLLFDVQMSIAPIKTTETGIPYTESLAIQEIRMRVPISVSMGKKKTSYGYVYSGEIKNSDLEKRVVTDVFDREEYWLLSHNAQVEYAEVKFTLGF